MVDLAKDSTAPSPRTVYLKDYEPPAYLIEDVQLRFELDPARTLVSSRLLVRHNPDSVRPGQPLVLNGQDLELLSVTVNGVLLGDHQYRLDSEQLVLDPLADHTVLEIQTRIAPDRNTALEGLYVSSGMFCTQCEAEGFRRITFFPDRPDVMARYTTTLVADKRRYPVLLSNGNPVEQGELADGRHWVTWQDPFPKPSYLFALVAGNLYCQQDRFTTRSGREVTLKIFVEPENSGKCDHALHSLKQAMRWDEDTYGREYDLDIFMIVAVNDFNMGAMENKGLNIFNSSCVLASPETATDADYYNIQSIIGHEYFHNWSGNRVTCRDWFQLSLKEGFTVFRDQEFSADLQLPAGETHRRCQRAARPPVLPGRQPDGPSGAPGRVHGDQQLLHRHCLQQGRRSGPHDTQSCAVAKVSARAATCTSIATTARPSPPTISSRPWRMPMASTLASSASGTVRPAHR